MMQKQMHWLQQSFLEHLPQSAPAGLQLEHVGQVHLFHAQGTLRLTSSALPSRHWSNNLALHYHLNYTPLDWLFFSPARLHLSADVFSATQILGVSLPKESGFFHLQGDVQSQEPITLRGNLSPFYVQPFSGTPLLISSATLTIQGAPQHLLAQLEIPVIGTPLLMSNFFSTQLTLSHERQNNVATNRLSWGQLHHPAMGSAILEAGDLSWKTQRSEQKEQLTLDFSSKFQAQTATTLPTGTGTLSFRMKTEDIALDTLDNVLLFYQAYQKNSEQAQRLLTQNPTQSTQIQQQYAQWQTRQFQQLLLRSFKANPSVHLEQFNLQMPSGRVQLQAQAALNRNAQPQLSFAKQLNLQLQLQMEGALAQQSAQEWQKFSSWGLIQSQSEPPLWRLALTATPTQLQVNQSDLSRTSVPWRQHLARIDAWLGLPATLP